MLICIYKRQPEIRLAIILNVLVGTLYVKDKLLEAVLEANVVDLIGTAVDWIGNGRKRGRKGGIRAVQGHGYCGRSSSVSLMAHWLHLASCVRWFYDAADVCLHSPTCSWSWRSTARRRPSESIFAAKLGFTMAILLKTRFERTC